MAKVYEDTFTLDGRVKHQLGVTKTKVAKVKELLTAHLSGDPVATGYLKEALTTSDAIFNLAYLTNLNFLPAYDEAPRTWNLVAGERTVPDFRPATLFSINRSWTDGDGESNVLGANGQLPTIPEGTAYPYAYISGEASQGQGVRKTGLKTDWTLESWINDGLGALDDLPRMLLEAALDTEEADVYGAIRANVPGKNLVGGPVPGATAAVPANSALTADAMSRAIIELSNRTINGRKIVVTGGYNLIVPVGQGLFAEFLINSKSLSEIDETQSGGTRRYSINGYNPLAGVSVVESEFFTGTEWALLPKPGATRRPVVEHLRLRGFEAPQLFVDNHTGNPIGAARVAPFEGSFASDSITLKLRHFSGGVVWDGGQAIVYSEGDNN